MFGLLKNKISSFIDSLTKREEEKLEKEQAPEKAETIPEPQQAGNLPVQPKPAESTQKPMPLREQPKQAEAKPVLKPAPIQEPPKKAGMPKPIPPAPKPAEMPKPAGMPKPAEHKLEPKPAGMPKPAEHKLEPKPAGMPKPAEHKLEPKPASMPKPKPPELKLPPAKKPEEKIKVSLSLESKVRGLILGQVEVKEKDVDDLLQVLEMALLEADVAFEVSQSLTEDLKRKLVGKKVGRGEVQKAIKEAVTSALRDTLGLKGPDLLVSAEERNAAGEPLKILFVGPNGAGKTTTMAKIAEKFMKAGKTVLFSASDSYRAAAIEQTEEHAKRLGIRAIKHGYGADPAAICYDAVNYAKAHKIDVVLMDTAGRQETNRNLIDELKKISRVAKPDLKIFIGESIAGNALVEQVRAFKEAVGLDGVILTKLDCDAKGGTAFSVAKATGVPILFFGVGQGYGDLLPFDPDFVVKQVFE